MAMLADPRRKQKISSDPRGSNWSNDDSKFGQKLMEKMGWSKGKGLGANEDGNTDHVSVTVKNNSRGVGCSTNHADNWIAHQDDFNSLLANLNQDHVGSDVNTEESKVSSLEQKSKTSKGRVHYQKFTKGKDLSRRSENDLACVFGKRKSKSGNSTPQTESKPNSDSEETNHGVQTVTSTDSVHDYFKKKMAEKMQKLGTMNRSSSDSMLYNKENSRDTDSNNSRGVDRLGSFAEPNEYNENIEEKSIKCEAEVDETVVENPNIHKKKKKSKKIKAKDLEVERELTNNDNNVVNNASSDVKGNINNTKNDINDPKNDVKESKSKKKLKKNKRKGKNEDSESNINMNVESTVVEDKLVKREERADEKVDEKTEMDAVSGIVAVEAGEKSHKKKKSKKRKRDFEEKVEDLQDEGCDAKCVKFTVGDDDGNIDNTKKDDNNDKTLLKQAKQKLRNKRRKNKIKNDKTGFPGANLSVLPGYGENVDKN